MPITSMLSFRLLPRRCLILVWCFGVTSLSPHARAVGPHYAHKEAKEQIQDLEERWRTATLAGDTTVMDGMLANDYVGISWNGQVNTKSTQLDRVRTRSFEITSMQIYDTRIKLLGEVAIVTAGAEISGTNDGAPIQGLYRYTRVYQHLSAGWRITNFEATRLPKNQRWAP